MNIEEFRYYCLGLPHVEESFPFDDSTLVFMVAGKMFSMIDIAKHEYINLKCDPDRSVELRERYDGVRPGYHMNKRHWNSVYLDSDVPDAMIKELIRHSYDCVVAKLPKKIRESYAKE
jgi:predicted DNA-binding protein (MmcQ/YjbR family)